jgi:hypothetical protein
MSDASDPAEGERRWRHMTLSVIAVACAVIAVVAVVLLVDVLRGSDEISAPTNPTTTEPGPTTPTTTEPAGTTEPPTTVAPTTMSPTTIPPTTAGATTVPVPPIEQLAHAIYPTSAMNVRFDDPVEAVRAFASGFVGFSNPVVGEFMAGDNRSGEVEVMAGGIGPVTTVFVRQLGPDDSWFVIGAATENIVVDQPEALAVIDSPLTVSGEARAFEGTVAVEIRGDDLSEALFTGFVTGSGDDQLGPFESVFEFEHPTTGGGSILFITNSPKDGTVMEVGALRVFFAEP